MAFEICGGQLGAKSWSRMAPGTAKAVTDVDQRRPQHVEARGDRPTMGRSVRLYVNGALINHRQPVRIALQTIRFSSATGTASVQYLNGLIDEVRLYTRVFSAVRNSGRHEHAYRRRDGQQAADRDARRHRPTARPSRRRPQ